MRKNNLLSLAFLSIMLTFMACGEKTNAAEDTTATEATTTNEPIEVSDEAQATGEATTEEAPVGPITSVEFKESEHDFGTVDDGKVVLHEFEFKNTGTEPLVISNCKGSCGCTVPDWPKEPIAPGASSKITVKYDSKGKGSPEGRQENKRVTVTANTNPVNSYLFIKGIVKGGSAATQAK